MSLEGRRDIHARLHSSNSHSNWKWFLHHGISTAPLIGRASYSPCSSVLISALSRKGWGFLPFVYKGETKPCSVSYFTTNHSTERIYDWSTHTVKEGEPLSRVSKACGPLGGEAPLCTSSPVQSLRRRCLEERTPRRVEDAFRTVTSPWTVEWSEKL